MAVAQSGVSAPDTVSIVTGSTLPIASAQASPPATASAIERTGIWRCVVAKLMAIMTTSPRQNQDAAAFAATGRFAGVQRKAAPNRFQTLIEAIADVRYISSVSENSRCTSS